MCVPHRNYCWVQNRSFLFAEYPGNTVPCYSVYFKTITIMSTLFFKVCCFCDDVICDFGCSVLDVQEDGGWKSCFRRSWHLWKVPTFLQWKEIFNRHVNECGILAKTVTIHFLENLCGRDTKRLLMALTQNFHVISVRERFRKMWGLLEEIWENLENKISCYHAIKDM